MRHLIFAFSFLFITSFLFAQEQEDCQSIMTIKRNFMERNLALSDNECQAFWDFYNPYLKEESEIFEASRTLLHKNNIKRSKGRVDYTKLNDKQLYILMEDRIDTKEKLIQLEKKLYEQLKKILSAKTLYQFYQIEGRFRADIKEEAKGACTHEKQ
ncbi:MAG: hypothetical protein FWC34_07310 [Bacteroidetes bacterium]|nr:hypothetical protein [Bacteroidota bacterium]MCL2302804.1 hypothetical protein [Lentimicrobiaceae bacterium]